MPRSSTSSGSRPAPTAASAGDVQRALRELATPARAEATARFFKTAPGQYGEGDRFLGVSVPGQRTVARQFDGLALEQWALLLASPWHEDRLTALLGMVRTFERAPKGTRDAVRHEVLQRYLTQLEHVNNWDLVDSSASQILGAWALEHPESVETIRAFARSDDLWRRRVAIVSTHAFIKSRSEDLAFEIASTLLADPHDLIHKATGWMLREVGTRVGTDRLRAFLQRHAPRMPRTTLRYAIEKFPEAERKRWLLVPRDPPRRDA